MRVGISIILNAERHLKNWGDQNALNVDHWIIVHGAVLPTNCTSWCRSIPEQYTNKWKSVDDTEHELERLKKKYKDKIIIIDKEEEPWNGKIEMFDAAINAMEARKTVPDFIWQIDADEYWSLEEIESAEDRLKYSNAICSRFLTDCVIEYVKNEYAIQVFGQWGEGKDSNFKRCWKYSKGAKFTRHEPPIMDNETGIEIGWDRNPERPLHLSYYYEDDVLFKSQFYRGHETVFQGWNTVKNLMKSPKFKELYGSALFMNQGKGLEIKNNTRIKRIPIEDISSSLLKKLDAINE